MVEADPVIWTARPRIDHVVIFQASAPRIFNAAALAAAVDLAAVIASVAGEAVSADLAVIASAVADSVAAALEGLAAAVEASEAGGENYAWNSPFYFLKTKQQNKPLKERT
jgi:hypothetical protein